MAVVDFLNRQVESPGEEEVGIGGFKMLARTRQTFTYTSQAPTAYLEDGSFASDHVVLDPLTLSIEGSVSDVFVEPTAVVEELRRTQGTVGQFAGYLPGRTQSQIQRINGLAVGVLDKARQIDSIIDDGKQALSFLGDQTEEAALRERFVDSMEALHYGKQLVSIDMPFRRFDSMRITSVSFTQDNQREAIQFSIQAQKVRITETRFVELAEVPAAGGATGAGAQAGKPAEGLNGQTEGETDKGAQEGEDKPQSILSFGAILFGV